MAEMLPRVALPLATSPTLSANRFEQSRIDVDFEPLPDRFDTYQHPLPAPLLDDDPFDALEGSLNDPDPLTLRKKWPLFRLDTQIGNRLREPADIFDVT